LISVFVIGLSSYAYTRSIHGVSGGCKRGYPEKAPASFVSRQGNSSERTEEALPGDVARQK